MMENPRLSRPSASAFVKSFRLAYAALRLLRPPAPQPATAPQARYRRVSRRGFAAVQCGGATSGKRRLGEDL
jgi:hypothetical protein